MQLHRSDFYRFYNWLKEFIVPGLRNAQFAYRDLLKSTVNSQTRWLDLGCGHQILPAWMPQADQDQSELTQLCELIIGLDRECSGMLKHKFIHRRILGDLEYLPFRSGAFNLITANMVVEHVKNPASLLQEVHRSLQPGGLFSFHTPNRWSYFAILSSIFSQALKTRLIGLLLGRKEEDIFPTYYRMNSPRALKKMASVSGFDAIDLKLVNSSAVTVMLGPLVIFELVLIRILSLAFFKNFRSNIIAQFRKSPPGSF
ncbi:MAG TPA: class I SAM-dependent methyltransferase [bacterium]